MNLDIYLVNEFCDKQYIISISVKKKKYFYYYIICSKNNGKNFFGSNNIDKIYSIKYICYYYSFKVFLYFIMCANHIYKIFFWTQSNF